MSASKPVGRPQHGRDASTPDGDRRPPEHRALPARVGLEGAAEPAEDHERGREQGAKSPIAKVTSHGLSDSSARYGAPAAAASATEATRGRRAARPGTATAGGRRRPARAPSGERGGRLHAGARAGPRARRSVRGAADRDQRGVVVARPGAELRRARRAPAPPRARAPRSRRGRSRSRSLPKRSAASPRASITPSV